MTLAQSIWRQADLRGTIPYRKKRDFPLGHSVKTGSVVHAISYPVGVCDSFPPGVKSLRSESDHLTQSNAEIKSCGAIPPLSRTSSWQCA
jgi:hypothetical protein